MTAAGKLVLYMGGPVASRERLISAAIPCSPRTLIIAPDGSLRRLRLLLAEHETPYQSGLDNVRSIFTSANMRFIAHGEAALRLVREQTFSHIFIANVAQMFRPNGGFLDWIYDLSYLVRQTRATVVADIAAGVVAAPEWWDQSMHALGLIPPNYVSFWLNTQAEPVRYVRFEAEALQIFGQHYRISKGELHTPTAIVQ